MDGYIIFITLTIFAFAGYIVWPSRYNVTVHMAVGGGFISIFVPTLILQVEKNYPEPIVDLYVQILSVGAITFLVGIIIGFFVGKGKGGLFSFHQMEEERYERRVEKLTKTLLIYANIGLIISYLGMGFVPMFADEPIAAKFFRDPYQERYMRVAILFRSSFMILGTIVPIACIIWYQKRSNFFLYSTILAIILMSLSLQRVTAFSGVVFAFVVVMSFKGRKQFIFMMISLIGIFILSSFFYYIVGTREFVGDEDVWEVIVAGAPDIQDQLNFLTKFEQSPVWTNGKTMWGGLIPGHYKWNPSVYTLSIVAPNRDVNDIGSGGLRLPLPMWGYVSFKWMGVVAFSFLTGVISGIYLRILKDWFKKFESILIRTTALIAFGAVFGVVGSFTLMNMYTLPPAFIMLFYLYRFKL